METGWLCFSEFVISNFWVGKDTYIYSVTLRDAKPILLQPMNLTGTSLGLPKSLTTEYKFKDYVGLGPKCSTQDPSCELLCILIYHKKREKPRHWKVLRYLNPIAVKCLKTSEYMSPNQPSTLSITLLWALVKRPATEEAYRQIPCANLSCSVKPSWFTVPRLRLFHNHMFLLFTVIH